MKYENMKLEDLLLLAKKGDGRAFEQIVLQTERAVYNLAFSIVKKKEDAEDVTQETYLRLWRAASELKLESSLKLYILRTARNLALDLIRKNSKRDEIDTVILDAEGEFEIDIADDSPDSRPDESYLRKIEKEVVRQSIEELPSAAREIIVLRDIEGLSYTEITEMLGLAEGTLKSKLFRARERLRKIILSKNIL
ncbi:MAG: sigma-70 family RNA polymerase sigma factor [Clostridia bacterium]|nr:sigma-70 family RNA polymerase sigma factor [Clostridia bacterium]